MACSRTIPARSILSDNSPLACLERGGETAAVRVRFHKRNKTLETAMIGANWEGNGGKPERESCGGWVWGGGCVVYLVSWRRAGVRVRARQQTKDRCHSTK
jgi:hypothetical protein